MSGSGTTKDENHPHPSLPRRGGRIQGGGIFILTVMRLQPDLDIPQDAIMFRFVEDLVVKTLVEDELPVDGGHPVMEHLRAGRMDQTVRTPLEDQ